MTKALRDGGLTAGDLDYLEAHGTGTSLGDPIEIRGLTTAFSRDGIKGPGSLPIGSVKSNVGHLESAASSVALTKVLLQMRHRTLVPSLHATPANPEIDFDGVPFTVQQQLAPWNTRDGSDRPLRAGIGSFGAGGGNAYLVIEEAPRRAPAPAPAARQPLVLFLSARTDSALAAYARDLAAYLRQARDRGEAPEPADVVFTFAAGRADLARRAALPADSLEELLSGLAAVAEGRTPQPVGGPAAATVADWLAEPPHRPPRRLRCRGPRPPDAAAALPVRARPLLVRPPDRAPAQAGVRHGGRRIGLRPGPLARIRTYAGGARGGGGRGRGSGRGDAFAGRAGRHPADGRSGDGCCRRGGSHPPRSRGGVGPGPDPGSGLGPGPGSGLGSGPGPGSGLGLGPGPGSGSGLGSGLGSGADGLGLGPGFGPGPGFGADGLGPSAGPEPGPGPGSGAGLGRLEPSAGPGPGPRPSLRAAPGLGAGPGPGTSPGLDPGPGPG
ncbi:hypothetical protein GCM10020000_75630 [Streptomyces olivoverticillatus]